jgi:hypothetical protein
MVVTPRHIGGTNTRFSRSGPKLGSAYGIRTPLRIIEAHLLAARHLLARGDTQAALGEAETGLLHAVACGFGFCEIELLVALARIRRA